MANTTTKKTLTKAELEALVAELQAQVAALSNGAVAETVSAPAEPVQPSIVPVSSTPSTDVTVVYCSDSMGYAKISNAEFHFNRFGEEFILNRYQFDELVGKYRHWFDDGRLAVSSRNMDVAIAKGVRTDKEYNLTYAKLSSMGKMNTTQLENLWNSCDCDKQKQSIVTFYKRKFIEGDIGYTDRAKVDLMNRLTNGGFNRESDELSGRYKIAPTEM